jgi:hypothetical protein
MVAHLINKLPTFVEHSFSMFKEALPLSQIILFRLLRTVPNGLFPSCFPSTFSVHFSSLNVRPVQTPRTAPLSGWACTDADLSL